jgi:hypothetical protein
MGYWHRSCFFPWFKKTASNAAVFFQAEVWVDNSAKSNVMGGVIEKTEDESGTVTPL